MLKSFFRTSFRNLGRHKGFSFINIAGLTLGLTACLLIGLFVWDEKQYDQFVPGGDLVYRLYTERTDNEGTVDMAWTPPMFASTLEQEFPEVDKTVRILNLQSRTLVEAGGKKIYEEGGMA